MNGGTKLDDWPFSSWPRQQFGAVDASLRLPEIPNNWHRLAIAVGSCIMLGLSWLQLNVVGWPVSPVGFIMASTWAMDNVLWSAALIGWLVVFLIKRLGGLLLYRRLRPAFLGLIIGDYLAGGFWSLLGTITAYLRLTH
jgi:hypothetical protein